MLKAVQLLDVDSDTSTLVLAHDALEELRQLRGSIKVVAVCGKARQGKSTLMNMLASVYGQQDQQLFKVTSEFHTCTKGIWATVIELQNDQGHPENLVLLDCEGLDAHDQSEQRSAALLSLASQLSSFFVYNHNDLVGASFLEHLALGLQRSNRLLRNSKSEYTDSDAASEDDVDAGRLDQDADDDCPHTARRSSAVSVLSDPGSPQQPPLAPSLAHFLLLLRDHDLEGLAPSEVLELALQESDAEGRQRNEERRAIKAAFPQREAYGLPRPALRTANLQRQKLNPEFHLAIHELAQLLLERAAPKQLGGRPMSGAAWADLLEGFVEAINHGALDGLPSVYQAVVDHELSRALGIARQVFWAALESELAPQDADLAAACEYATTCAMAEFNATALGDARTRLSHESMLRVWAGAQQLALTAASDYEEAAAASDLAAMHAEVAAAAASRARAAALELPVYYNAAAPGQYAAMAKSRAAAADQASLGAAGAARRASAASGAAATAAGRATAALTAGDAMLVAECEMVAQAAASRATAAQAAAVVEMHMAAGAVQKAAAAAAAAEEAVGREWVAAAVAAAVAKVINDNPEPEARPERGLQTVSITSQASSADAEVTIIATSGSSSSAGTKAGWFSLLPGGSSFSRAASPCAKGSSPVGFGAAQRVSELWERVGSSSLGISTATAAAGLALSTVALVVAMRVASSSSASAAA